MRRPKRKGPKVESVKARKKANEGLKVQLSSVVLWNLVIRCQMISLRGHHDQVHQVDNNNLVFSRFDLHLVEYFQPETSPAVCNSKDRTATWNLDSSNLAA